MTRAGFAADIWTVTAKGYFHLRANCRARWRTGSPRVWSEEMALSHSDCGWPWSHKVALSLRDREAERSHNVVCAIDSAFGVLRISGALDLSRSDFLWLACSEQSGHRKAAPQNPKLC